MTTNDIKVARERIMRGETAKLVIPAKNFDLAEQIFATLPPALRARLTLIKAEV